MKKEIKDENLIEYKNSVNPHSLDKTKEKCEVLKMNLQISIMKDGLIANFAR
jgi:hypothetical protein